MKHETLERIIDQVRDGSAADRISIRQLLGNVSIAKVWEHLEGLTMHAELGDLVYLINDPVAGCVGACYWMRANDFHVLLKEDYRGRGLMTNALRDIILPHIFQRISGDIQEATESASSERLLRRLGFTPILGCDAGRVRIFRHQCKEVLFPSAEPFTKEKKQALRRHFAVTACMMEHARFQLETTAGAEHFHDELEHLREHLTDLRAADDLLDE